MPNFTKSSFTYREVTYSRYTADRKRGGGSWVFFAFCPAGTVYSPTWGGDITGDPPFAGVFFLSKMEGDVICVDFLNDLSSAEETALENLYTGHVAPVPV